MSDPLIGVNSPSRLLREQWRSPADLAQELYAMFTAKGPREIHDTLTIRVPEGKPAIRVVREEGDTNITEGHTFGVTKAAPSGPGNAFPRPRPERAEAESRRRDFARSEPGDRRRREDPAARSDPASSAPGPRPDIEFDASAGFTKPVTFGDTFFQQEPRFLDRATGRFETLGEVIERRKAKPMIGGGESSPPAKAIVLDGSGDTYTINLFTSADSQTLLGSNGQATVFTMKIPFIAEDDQILQGTVCYPVFKEGDYYVYQPPVWMP